MTATTVKTVKVAVAAPLLTGKISNNNRHATEPFNENGHHFRYMYGARRTNMGIPSGGPSGRDRRRGDGPDE
jgi:hypothetical protein